MFEILLKISNFWQGEGEGGEGSSPVQARNFGILIFPSYNSDGPSQPRGPGPRTPGPDPRARAPGPGPRALGPGPSASGRGELFFQKVSFHNL